MKKTKKIIKYASQNPDFCAEYGIALQPAEEVDVDDEFDPEVLLSVPSETISRLMKIEALFNFVDSLDAQQLRILQERIQIRKLLVGG